MLTWVGAIVCLGCQASWWSQRAPRIWRPVVVNQILFAPVLEEGVFRGIVQSSLKPILQKYGISQSRLTQRQIQITSLLSGVLHGYFGHYRSIASRIQLALFAGIGSWLYGNVYEKHSLGAATLLHGMYNSVTLGLAMQWGSASPWLIAAQGVYLLSLQIFLLFKLE